MEKCKFCQAELPEESKEICPQCGKNQAEAVEEELTAQPISEDASEDAAEQTEAEAAEETAEEAAEETAEEAAEETAEESEEEAAAEESVKKATPGKIAAAVAAIVVLAAVLIALILAGMKNKPADIQETLAPEATEQVVAGTVPADGNPEDVTCKGSYTVSDEEAIAAKDTVVAKAGDYVLTNGELQVYYWSIVNSYLSSEMGYTLMMYGLLDYTQPLDTTMSFEDSTLTWQQYFLQEALDYWHLSQSLAADAEIAGYAISQEDQAYLDNLPTSLEETAASYGMTRDELLLRNVGPGAGLEEFAAFQTIYAAGKDYYQDKLAEMVPTQEQLEAFYAEHEEDYIQSGITKDSVYVDVRHILIQVEGAEAATDEAWETCRQEAQAVLDQWLAGEKTEESFAALANTASQDPGSNTNGGLYENVNKGQMVEPFDSWCFDESRQYGDYGLVQTSYGYHVMFYVGSEPVWLTAVESDWTQTQANLFIEERTVNYPLEVYYDQIALGYINLAG